jgi:hypothetical protein
MMFLWLPVDAFNICVFKAFYVENSVLVVRSPRKQTKRTGKVDNSQEEEREEDMTKEKSKGVIKIHQLEWLGDNRQFGW